MALQRAQDPEEPTSTSSTPSYPTVSLVHLLPTLSPPFMHLPTTPECFLHASPYLCSPHCCQMVDHWLPTGTWCKSMVVQMFSCLEVASQKLKIPMGFPFPMGLPHGEEPTPSLTHHCVKNWSGLGLIIQNELTRCSRLYTDTYVQALCLINISWELEMEGKTMKNGTCSVSTIKKHDPPPKKKTKRGPSDFLKVGTKN